MDDFEFDAPVLDLGLEKLLANTDKMNHSGFLRAPKHVIQASTNYPSYVLNNKLERARPQKKMPSYHIPFDEAQADETAVDQSSNSAVPPTPLSELEKTIGEKRRPKSA